MSRRVVVDSSVIVKWFIPEEHSEKADRILNDHLDGRIRATAPSHALLETANALRKYVVRGVISPNDALEALSLLLDVDVEFVGIAGEAALKALRYALEAGITVYDAYYVLLARSLQAPFYTADEKLVRQLGRREPLVRHLAEYR